jgi:hypothetical protein
MMLASMHNIEANLHKFADAATAVHESIRAQSVNKAHTQQMSNIASRMCVEHQISFLVAMCVEHQICFMIANDAWVPPHTFEVWS